MRTISLTGICMMLCAVSAFAYQAPGNSAPAGSEVYIVTFEEPGALRYDGGLANLPATSGILRSRTRNAGANPDVAAYRDHLDSVLDSYAGQMGAELGRGVEPMLRYSVRSTGMAVALTASEAQQLAGMPGIIDVRKDVTYELDTDAGPQWIGADKIWDGSSTPDAMPNFGGGVLVGVLDTGVNMDHPSFSDSPEDGHTYVNPLGSGNFIGACDGVTFVCNDKLIGAWDFADPFGEADGPEDSNGHGSHTASTAVGNFLTGPFIDGSTGNIFDAPSMSGVARHANLITYDVCVATCPGASIQGGIDQAIMDGVDILNFSISGGTSPWNDNDRGFLDLFGNGTLVNASAGNLPAGDTDPTGDVGHRGPWVMTVANQTHNRVNSNAVSAVGGPGNLQDMYGLLGVLDAFGGMDLTAVGIYAGNVDPGNFEGCTAWPGGNEFTGAIALVSRGSCNFSVKIDNAAAAGAVGVLVYNNQSLLPIVMGGIETTTIPSLMLGQANGEALRDYLTSNPGTMVMMSGTAIRSIMDEVGSFISSSSLRGPNNFDVTKPDVGGPGTNIFAAYADNIGPAPQFNFLSGTSMSSPHSAGSSALLKSIHPDWTPAEIKSALMMTARSGFNEAGDPANPDIEGSGTIDVSKAANAGVVMNENFDNFLAANPATGGDPATLNLASMRSGDCDGTCEWTRTVCSTLDVATSWSIGHQPAAGYSVSVNPDAFELTPSETILDGGFEDAGAAGSCQTFNVSVTINDTQLVTDGVLIFDQIILSENGALSPDLKLTITFLPTGIDL
jgi:hypothetical protein